MRAFSVCAAQTIMMHDMKCDEGCRYTSRSIYLPDFDLDGHGNFGPRARLNPEANIKLYALMFDQVRLQSSSVLKVPVLGDILAKEPSLFNGGGRGAPLVSLGLERGIECYAHYYERRMSILTSKASSENTELKVYEGNDAAFKARLLDQFVPKGLIERPEGSVEGVFKRELLDGNARFQWDESELDFAHYVDDYCTKSEFFQTFDLKKKLSDIGVGNERILLFSEMARSCYFGANARVFGGLVGDWHGDLVPLKSYVGVVLGLGINELERLGFTQMLTLKEQPLFGVLREAYFSITDTGSLGRVCAWVQRGFPAGLRRDVVTATDGAVSAPLFRYAVEYVRHFISKGLRL